MSQKKNKRFHSSDGSLSIEQLKTICPDQYVTYEIFDLAFKQMWAVVNKLEMLQLQQNQNDKLFELEKRILNLEDVIHKLTAITPTIPEALQQQITELSENGKQILITIPQKLEQYSNELQDKEERVKQVEDTCNILTRVLHDVQSEYEEQKEQVFLLIQKIERIESDLMNMFKQFQSVLKLEQDYTHIQADIQNITKAINEIYQFI